MKVWCYWCFRWEGNFGAKRSSPWKSKAKRCWSVCTGKSWRTGPQSPPGTSWNAWKGLKSNKHLLVVVMFFKPPEFPVVLLCESELLPFVLRNALPLIRAARRLWNRDIQLAETDVYTCQNRDRSIPCRLPRDSWFSGVWFHCRSWNRIINIDSPKSEWLRKATRL